MEYINVQGMIVKRIVKIIILLGIGIVCLGCGNSYSLTQQDDIPSWSVRLSMPSYYPIKALDIYGINNEKDWAIPLIGLSMAGNNSADLKYVRSFYSPEEYDGFSLVLNPFINGTGSQAQRNSVQPDSMYIKWISLFDNTLYYTKIHFSDDVIKFMNYQEYDDLNHSDCYHNTIVLGFLPNGHVKTWLYGCGRYTYISVQDPDKIIKTKVSNEYDPKDWATVPQYLINKAKKYGVDIIPVPWDKVDKVKIPPKNYQLENFSDIDKSSFQE